MLEIEKDGQSIALNCEKNLKTLDERFMSGESKLCNLSLYQERIYKKIHLCQAIKVLSIITARKY